MYGNIQNWPENFFGDEMGDITEQAKAAMKKRMSQSASGWEIPNEESTPKVSGRYQCAKTANLAVDPATYSRRMIACVLACVEAVEHVVKKGGLVLDAGDEIYNEYRRQLSMKGQPGMGDQFMKWVHDNRWKFPMRIALRLQKMASHTTNS